MPGPEFVARARQLMASPGVSPETKARLQEQLRVYDERAAAGVANATAQRVSEVVQDEDVFAAKVRAARERPAPTSRSPEDIARARALEEAGSGSGQAMAAVEGGLRGPTLSGSDVAGAALTGAAHALTSPGVPELTPEARGRMAKLGIQAPPVDERSVWERGYDSAREQQDLRREANPVTAIASEVGMSILPALASGGTSALARASQFVPSAAAANAGTAAASRLANPLARAVVGSGIGSGLAGGVTSAVEGGDAGDVIGSGLRGFGIGSGFGLLSQGAKALGRQQVKSLRDPNTDMGRSLALAKQAGAETDTLQRVRRGPRLDQLTEETPLVAGPGVAPEALATERAAGELGGTLAQRQSTTLGRATAGNQAQYAKGDEITLATTGRAALGELKRYSHADGRPLPGAELGKLAGEVRKSGEVRIVPANSPEAYAAAAEDQMEVGLARNLGLLPKGAAQAEDADKLVIFDWSRAGARQMDDVERSLRSASKSPANVHDPATEPMKRIASAARQNRGEFGPEWRATKAQQSEELGAMRDAFEASGLPRGLDDIDLGRFSTKEDLFRAVSAYRTKSNLPADRLLDEMATGNPRLRQLLDEAAGARATAQLRGEPVDPRVAAGAGGLHTFGVGSGLRLRLDPTMRALAEAQDSLPAVPAAISAEAARERRRRGFR